MAVVVSLFASFSSFWGRLTSSQRRLVWPSVAALATLAVFGTTLQTGINGSVHAYATDVGEIQNALPRWGIIHHSGYPQYSVLGSLFVTLLRPVGIEPAASTSLFSALWGALAAGLMVVLAQELGARGPMAVLGALAAALSTSVWVFASLAEVHTLTLVLTLATLIFAVRFGRSGERRDLVLLALFFSQGVVHQRSVLFLAPAVLILVWPQLRCPVARSWPCHRRQLGFSAHLPVPALPRLDGRDLGLWLSWHVEGIPGGCAL